MALECVHLLYQIFSVFHNLAILFFSETVIFMINWGGNMTSCRPIRSVIVSIKSSIVIGSSGPYLSRNRRVITGVSNYWCPI